MDCTSNEMRSTNNSLLEHCTSSTTNDQQSSEIDSSSNRSDQEDLDEIDSKMKGKFLITKPPTLNPLVTGGEKKKTITDSTTNDFQFATHSVKIQPNSGKVTDVKPLWELESKIIRNII